jgi:hypothetical protein
MISEQRKVQQMKVEHDTLFCALLSNVIHSLPEMVFPFGLGLLGGKATV